MFGSVKLFMNDEGIYPQKFISSPETSEFSREEREQHISAGSIPRIFEFRDYYKIEMTVRGFRNHNIHISIFDDLLTVCCLRRETGVKDKLGTRQGIEWKSMRAHCRLPPNADPDFATAEFRNDLLNIFLFKTWQRVHNCKVNIVVY